MKLTYPGEDTMSPTLRAGLAMDVVGILVAKCDDDLAKAMALKPATDVLAEFRDPRAVAFLVKLHDHACAAMRRKGIDRPKAARCAFVARNALAQAVELSKLFYGKQHPFSIMIRKADQKASLTHLGPVFRD